MSESSTAEDVLDLLRASHDRLAATLQGLSEQQATSQSYDDDWSVAQVASHLGSGAEIQRLQLAAGLKGEEAPGMEAIQPIWDEWNAKAPLDQVHDSVAANAALLEDVTALTPDERERWQLELWGRHMDLAMLLRSRLSEHAVHSWDILVSFDPTATLDQDATAVVVDNLDAIVGWTGQKRDEQISVEVRTSQPERAWHLDIGPGGVGLSPSYDDTSARAELALPAEAWVRLVYGRLDPDHTPESVEIRGADLDLLRATFPGV